MIRLYVWRFWTNHQKFCNIMSNVWWADGFSWILCLHHHYHHYQHNGPEFRPSVSWTHVPDGVYVSFAINDPLLVVLMIIWTGVCHRVLLAAPHCWQGKHQNSQFSLIGTRKSIDAQHWSKRCQPLTCFQGIYKRIGTFYQSKKLS